MNRNLIHYTIGDGIGTRGVSALFKRREIIRPISLGDDYIEYTEPLTKAEVKFAISFHLQKEVDLDDLDLLELEIRLIDEITDIYKAYIKHFYSKIRVTHSGKPVARQGTAN